MLDDTTVAGNQDKQVAVNGAGIEIDARTGQFLSGHKGGPGRPKGSRNQLAEAFIADCYKDWQANGIQALEDARKAKPADYLKVIASILPKDIKVTLETMSNDELGKRIDQLTQSLGLKLEPTTIDVTPQSQD